MLDLLALIASWIIAAFWTLRSLEAAFRLPHLPNLRRDSLPPSALAPLPSITVIVPARNEAAAIEATLRSLLRQTIPLAILAVDDRSTDATRAIMDRIAAEPLPAGKSLSVVHIQDLPEGWLGKPHAMALGASRVQTEWLLFTDADVEFSPDVLERALAWAVADHADHVVLLPTLILKTRGERMIDAFLQSMLLIASRLWKVHDPKARHEYVGMGAFNLIRASAYHAVGGFESEPIEVLEDLRLGFRVKRSGYRQRILLGRGLAQLHWAPGAIGLLHNLTKNIFATFRFRVLTLCGACCGIAIIAFAPFAALFGPWPLPASGIVSLAMVGLLYRSASRWFNPIPLRYAFTFPVAATLVLYAMLRSMIVTLVQGGVTWRGTFYPLRELRRHAGPLR